MGEQLQTGEPQTDPAAAVAAESDEETQWEQQVEEAVGRFANLGLIQVSGYVLSQTEADARFWEQRANGQRYSQEV